MYTIHAYFGENLNASSKAIRYFYDIPVQHCTFLLPLVPFVEEKFLSTFDSLYFLRILHKMGI